MSTVTPVRRSSAERDRDSKPVGVHVVTVTHNSASTIERYLDALRRSAPYIEAVTIVDNASTDDTRERIAAVVPGFPFPVQLVPNTNDGFAGGYRAAAISAVPRTIPALCLNPDVVLEDGAIEALLDVLNTFPESGVVTTPLVEVDGSPDTASRRKLPTLSGSVVYSVMGKLTPRSLRYNRIDRAPETEAMTAGGRKVTRLEATTGALMLIAPTFRTLDDDLFDTEYWMYGEDLQLCADAGREGRTVLMAEIEPSVHIKGVSSGRPRSHRSNRAFHDAMYRYARKNLVSNPVLLAGIRTGVWGHFVLSEVKALPVRVRRKRAAKRR